jgi:hypothetical protein
VIRGNGEIGGIFWPPAQAVTSKVPSLRSWRMQYAPVSSDVLSPKSSIAGFAARTLMPRSLAPVASETVPQIEPS